MIDVLIISKEASGIYAILEQCATTGRVNDEKRQTTPKRLDKEGLARYDVALLDLDAEGWQQRLLDLKLHMPVVAFSQPDLHLAVEAMRLGAVDYIEKPITAESFSGIISRYENQVLDHRYGFDEMLGTSPLMQEVFALTKRAATSESNVLITGESGTGKELVARAIHRWSRRKEGPFLTINCSAIPDSLLESELFGFERGSFTGAVQSKKGILERADGGTVFFDEIGDVSPLFQTKILRVIQEGEIMRIGGARPARIDIRIISATNKDLKSEITKGSFREDLFYRLNVINIHLPPLRERMEDLPLLIRHLVRKHSQKRQDLTVKGVSPEALKILMGYPFPGNVRELENILERALCMTDRAEIAPADLPSSLREAAPRRVTMTFNLRNALESTEKETILAALRETDWNVSRAATLLGVYRQQLQRKIRALKLTPERRPREDACATDYRP